MNKCLVYYLIIDRAPTDIIAAKVYSFIGKLA
jgi:hypothetical protein